MENPMDTNFGNLSDREIAECLYKAYGANLVRYAIKSWQQDEDDAWEILYDTLYGFINSYSAQIRFVNSERSREALKRRLDTYINRLSQEDR